MNDLALRFDNQIELTVRSGETGEVLHQVQEHNDISDDFLASTKLTLFMDLKNQSAPYCFLLKDGPAWGGFSWDRKNPWAPYCATLNNKYGTIYDTTADPHWKSRNYSYVEGRHRLFFQWTKLADDITVRALGLTGLDRWVPNYPESCGIVASSPSVFVPQTLVVLPSPITVHGRRGGSQIPDILEVSYFLSLVGVN